MSDPPLIRLWAIVALTLTGFMGVRVQADAECVAVGEIISTRVTLTDCILNTPRDLKIVAGGVLRLENAALRFEAPSGANLSVEKGGELEIEQGRIESAEGTLLKIVAKPQSTVAIRNAALEDYESMSIASGATTLEAVSMRGALTALQIEAGGVVRVINSTIQAGQNAVVVRDGGNVFFEGTSWTGSTKVDSNALLAISWFVQVNVTADYERPVFASLQDADGSVRATALLDEWVFDGARWKAQTPWALAPVQQRRGNDIEQIGPYRVFAVQDRNATHKEFSPAQNLQLDLHLDVDPDVSPPDWDSALSHEAPRIGYSTDGRVKIAWHPADDTLGGRQPNRALRHYQILVDGAETKRTRLTSAAIVGLPEGTHTFRVAAVDLVGNTAPTATLTALVDSTPPNVTFWPAPTHSDFRAYNGTATILVRAEDPGSSASGTSLLGWRVGEGLTSFVPPPFESQVALDQDGNHTLHVVAEDKAGNRVQLLRHVVVDTKPPVFQAYVDPQMPAGVWHRQPPTLHVDMITPGPSGLEGVLWGMDEAEWRSFTAPTALVADAGEHTLRVQVVDGAGNVALTQLRFAYDPDPPMLEVQVKGPEGLDDWFVGPVTLEAAGSDSVSGLAKVEVRIASGAWQPLLPGFRLEASGNHMLRIRAEDRAGNEATQTVSVHIDQEPPVPPHVVWTSLQDGRVRADWTEAPPLDSASGITRIRIQRQAPEANSVTTYDVEPKASGQVLVGLPSGEHRLRVVVTDAAGQEASSPWAPLESMGSPLSAAQELTARGTVVLRLNPSLDGEDIVEAQLYVDGILEGSTGEAPFAFEWRTQHLQDGPREIRLVALDSHGMRHEEIRTYHVNNGYLVAITDDPFPLAAAMLASLSGAVMAGVGYVRWKRWTR